MTDWPRTGPQDGAALVAAVNAATGLGLEYTGRLPGGNAGAALARLGGRDRVLTRWDEARLARWISEGRIKAELDIFDGLERAPEALIGLFEGNNRGKRAVRVS